MTVVWPVKISTLRVIQHTLGGREVEVKTRQEAVAFDQNQKLICDSATCQERAVWVCDCG